MTKAEVIVDALLEGWLKDKWNDFKAVSGVGSDDFGLGKNTERGWKARYGSQIPGKSPVARPLRRQRPQGPGENTWNIA